MNEYRLLDIKERIEGLESKPLHFADDYAFELRQTAQEALELVAEVERLNGRLEAVCGVLWDAAAFGAPVSDLAVMEAVRGT